MMTENSHCVDNSVSIVLRDFSVQIRQDKPVLPFLNSKNKSDSATQTKSTGGGVLGSSAAPLTAHLPSGKLTAIFGGSGSGKTTLLNAIAGRYDKNAYNLGGSILFGCSRGSTLRKSTCAVAYVAQEDFLHPCLTVRETLQFAAQLKIHNADLSSAASLQTQVVEDVILELGLKECANSLIGSNDGVSASRGISGGERRRVSVALQILNRPEVLCADEPTSGLDSFTAITLMECLKRLTEPSAATHTHTHPTTVICSIHQPRADIYNLLDCVLILSAGGQGVYCGSANNMLKYFSKLGFVCPTHANPADFFIDLTAVDGLGETERKESVERVSMLLNAYTNNMHSHTHNIDNTISSMQLLTLEDAEPTASFYTQLDVLIRRLYVCTVRDLSHVYGSLIQATLLGLIVMGIFYDIPETSEGISSRSGLMYIDVSMEMYMLMIICIQKLCMEMTSVVDRELQDGLYSSTAYFLGHWVTNLPLLTTQCIIYSVPIYYGCGLRPGFGNFVQFLCVNLTLMMLITSLSWCCVALHREFAVASLIGNTNFTFISLTAGFLVNYSSIPVYVSWVQNLSILSYGYQLLMTTEFSDRTFHIQDGVVISGNDVLQQYDVGVNAYLTPWCALIAIFVVYVTFGMVCLHVIKYPPTGSVGMSGGVVETESDNETAYDESSVLNRMRNDVEAQLANVVEAKEGSTAEIADPKLYVGTSIEVENLDLFVYAPDNQSQTLVGQRPLVQKQLLKNINLSIQPGRLVAIMGGSGSGKTTLLNLLANRIPHSCLTSSQTIATAANPTSNTLSASLTSTGQYFGTGSLRFNGKTLRATELRNKIAYVQQFDFHLPSLTVYETLLFHARLRVTIGNGQTDSQSKSDAVRKRVYEVLYTLNLVSCMHVRVGDEVNKGISGGEKRRLSIAVQLLVSPAVCLLDEPTTGLDAYTARRVVHLLRHIAHTPYNPSGNSLEDVKTNIRTVILSIHQPRYDIFACFDDVILLSKGHLVYAGNVENMYTHFENMSLPFPDLCNPADYLLDVSSIDFRSDVLEQSTKERLSKLVVGFQAYQDSKLPEEKPDESELKSGENGTVDDVNNQSVKADKSDSKSEKQEKSFFLALPLLLHRAFVNLYRQPLLITNRMSQGLFYGLILSCFYAPIGDDQNSIQNRIGNLYELTAICFIGMLSCIAIYPIERNVFYREYPDGYYSAYAYILCYFVISIPLLVATSLGIAALICFAVGLAPNGSDLM
eukprot:gene32249-39004_t